MNIIEERDCNILSRTCGISYYQGQLNWAMRETAPLGVQISGVVE